MTEIDRTLGELVAALSNYHKALLAAPADTFKGAERRAHEAIRLRPAFDLAGCPFMRPVEIAKWLRQSDLMADGASADDASEIASSELTPVKRG